MKAQERLRRRSSERILLPGPATRKPFDFLVFLENENKKTALPANVESVECLAGICEVAKCRNGSTNTFKLGGQFLFYIFSLFVVIFRDYTRQ